MHSSTSSSNTATNRDVVILLVLLLALAIGLEFAARVVMPRKSVGISRITHDLSDTMNLAGPRAADGRPIVLLVGNSLLLDGIDRKQLAALTRDAIEIHMLPIEATMYTDWVFGLKKLFYSGTRPSLIVLCINAEQMTSSHTNGPTFAHFMMPLREFPAVVRASHLAPMAASEYLLAHFSYWLATRGNVRMGVMERVLPGAKELVPHLTLVGNSRSSDPQGAVTMIVDRLHELERMSKQNGAEFLWLIPPTENRFDLAPVAAARATESGITVLFPYQPGEMPADKYKDGFHLNGEGAELFTARTAAPLVAVARQ